MRAETRHQLKQDRFSRATIDVAEKTVHWSVEHQNKLIVAGVAVLVIVGLAFGSWYYLNEQDQKASLEFSQAVRTLDTPVRPPNMPPQPDNPSFASSKERATAAHKQFQDIVNKYPHTHAADFGHYFLGLTSADMGDNAAAERELQAVASYHKADLSALAKFALASVYRNTNRDKQAIELYKQIIAKPTVTVSKATAQMELAATYQSANMPLEAKRIYEQIQKENPATEAAQMASAKLQALK
ncbi:MAG TPA: tetratricopeptide repeat protein [Terriglobales bacterium]|nr:tetratricopeptide repeat protein [Terriglobales bacterium]